MKRSSLSLPICLLLSAIPATDAFAATVPGDEPTRPVLNLTLPAGNDGVSSSAAVPDSPDAPAVDTFMAGAGGGGRMGDHSVRPFSYYAVALTAGVGGVGIDLATPIAPRMNLRLDGSYFSYNFDIGADEIDYNGDFQFRRGRASLDYFPFSGKFREGFRVSPGITFYNGNSGTATATVPAGRNFKLNNTFYQSAIGDPVHGTGTLQFGRKVAPSITVGFGNMLPGDGAHWSVPFEIGFEYVGTPTMNLSLAGTACPATARIPSCTVANGTNVATDSTVQANIAKEQFQLADDLKAFRFYPIATIGIAYRFGH